VDPLDVDTSRPCGDGAVTKPLVRLEPLWATDALMELQYRFPLSESPFEEVADRIGVPLTQLLAALRGLNARGVLKRVGFYFNYRAARRRAALIALATSQPEEATRYLAQVLEVTHSYLRLHPVYNLWVVGKHRDPEVIVQSAKEAAQRYGEGKWLVLWGVRTHRLSVKYDLYRGVSRAGPLGKVEQNPPTPEDLGIPSRVARSLRVLPLEPRPYRVLAERLGLDENTLHAYMREMLAKGILADPGAALDGHKLGFKYNAMFTLAPASGVDLPELCRWVARSVDEATHVVERDVTPPGAWRHLCYFMFHSVDEALAEPVRERIARSRVVDDVLVIPSLRDMLPGVIR